MAQPTNKAARQGCLASAKVAFQEDDPAPTGYPGELAAEGDHGRFVGQKQV